MNWTIVELMLVIAAALLKQYIDNKPERRKDGARDWYNDMAKALHDGDADTMSIMLHDRLFGA